MSRLSDALSSLTPEQRAVLEMRLRERAAAAAAERIRPRAAGAPAELSFAQERLWFVEQLMPSGAANHMPMSVRIEGPLSPERLGASLTALVARHEVLRSAVEDVDGRPVARIAPAAGVPLPIVEVPGATPSERLDAARQLVAHEIERPFDLAVAPLLRAKLFRVDTEDHVLSVVVHHIAADGWSLGVFGRELAALYEASSAAAPLEPLPIQYADFAAWQRRVSTTPRMAASLEWWRHHLAGVPNLELPTDYPRPAAASADGARASALMPLDLARRVSSFAAAEGVTPFMALTAALSALVMRWTGAADFAIGSPVAGRIAPEVEGLIGLFVNTIVLRPDLSKRPTFRELVARTRATVSDALAHGDVPFERVVDAAQPDRSLSHAPLTPLVFAFQNVPPATLALDGLRVSAFEVERSTSRFDLCLFAVDGADGIRLTAEYRSDLFRRATIERLLATFITLLDGLLQTPDVPVEDVPLVSAGEKAALRAAAAAGTRDYPADSDIPSMVAAAARAYPEAIAVTMGGARITYGDLDRAASRLAGRLAAEGVGRGDRVGVCLDRSIELVVTLLGVLKAGAAYVALEPTYPDGRLRHMIGDAGIRVVVASTSGAARVQGLVERVCLATDPSPTSAAPAPDVAIDADDLAYIAYTSGSTGLPKGVEVRHRSVLRLVCGVDYVQLDSSQTLLQLAPVAFDASTFEIWGALVHGGRLVLYPGATPDFGELAGILGRERISTLWLTASLYNAIVDADASMLRGVGQLLVGGEALSMAHVRRGMAALPGTRIINGYGPTEGTTFTCCHDIAAADVADDRLPVPIGRPIANTRVFVLDRHLEPVPPGFVGELCIGGDGLARGYTRAPRLTAERFVPDGVSGAAGERLYRTGDLVRQREDGAIEFLGRRDQQVKIRGFRIELGEIEAALTAHPGVRAAAAVVHDDPVRGKLVHAYIVAEPAARADESSLAELLAARLPEYMIPAAIQAIDALPRTPNGKVDRDALPGIDAPRQLVERREPTNEVEAIVIDTCRDLLGLPQVSLADGFFELGGHSLLATQFAARLQRAFQTEVRVRTIFETATLGELADVLLDALLDEEDDAPAS